MQELEIRYMTLFQKIFWGLVGADVLGLLGHDNDLEIGERERQRMDSLFWQDSIRGITSTFDDPDDF